MAENENVVRQFKGEDLTGRSFERWIVIGFPKLEIIPSGYKYWSWFCRCSCNKVERYVCEKNLRRGLSKSCGCLHKERARESHTKHGMSRRHPAYTTWANMWARCTNPKSARWTNYGGRGICVCEQWQTFDGFWRDMGSTWFTGASIERQDVNLGYTKPNCIWIPFAKQARNKTTSVMLTLNGVTKNAAEWAEEVGISRYTIYGRLKHGWSDEDALTTPKRITGRWS